VRGRVTALIGSTVTATGAASGLAPYC